MHVAARRLAGALRASRASRLASRHSSSPAADAPPAPAPPASPSWAALGVPPHVLGKLQRLRGVQQPTAVQRTCLPALLADLAAPHGDTVIHSETGSGKTLCYLLPIFARLDAKHAPAARLRAIIVTPTRELSLQVAAVAEELASVGSKKDPSRAVRVCRVVGEVSAQLLHDLKAAPPHVLVGTPATLARLVGVHVNTGELEALVLDEADELLRNHSVAAVKTLVAAVRKHGNRPATVAVSATSSFGLQQFVGEHMRKTVRTVDLTRGAMVTPSTLAHHLLPYGRANAMYNAFTRLLSAARPACVLSFHNSARSMEALEAHLRDHKVPVGLLGNAYANAQRARALEGVRTGRLRVLLSTEMAARGLDLPRVSHVVNFDPPTSIREYVHRAGRAGRLSSLSPGRAGTVVTFVGSDAEHDAMLDIARQLGVALGELRFEGGELASRPLLCAVADGEERALHELTLREAARFKAVRSGAHGGSDREHKNEGGSEAAALEVARLTVATLQ